jgi:hypothetical protein
MTSTVALLGLLIATIGTVGVVAPTRLLAIARWFVTPRGFYAAIVIRLLVGSILILAAPAGAWPGTFRVLGILVVGAGLLTPVIGLERSRTLLQWWSARGSWLHRLWGALALGLGLALFFSVAH